MKLEDGKKYTTRGGSVVGPVLLHERTGMFYTQREDLYREFWYPTGMYCIEKNHHLDLVEEYVDKTNWLQAGKWYEPQNKTYWVLVTEVDTLHDFAELVCIRRNMPENKYHSRVWISSHSFKNSARNLIEIECPFK